ncbi:CheR family methyltransferase [Oceanobacillus bengalensis]|uniref:protein-glutamate O-methyltransferase n=1 Tax=Oceanobacillus bengalensis TaxID=1435466 RepID=A0A494YUV6_9BACI|nr:protein-glutamate O-methyltransferase CheR [Oceanobacillus bengalensis]RKQ13951.1 protein-glutamate O-methyltransferase CheR [Oceanobacillus bengalensis]
MKDEYYSFIEKINRKVGIDLSLYKETQMKRRITTLRDKRGFNSFTSYYNALIQENDLLEEFIDRLTINVSEFYRNPKRWEVLQNTIFPLLIRNGGTLKIWSAACSTGDEPYSLAIMLKERFPNINATILATDLDENVLSKAKEGKYEEQALKDLPKPYLNKYFTKDGNGYRVDPSLKQLITFKKHNLLADKYPDNIDLIVCRNVLIYFTDEAKDTIYQNFSNALKLGGVLFVGSTEQIFNPNKYSFKLIDTFFYQKD